MKSIMLICVFIILICNLLTHRYLSQRIDILQEWIEVLHGIDFDKMSESVRKWQSEQKDGDIYE